MTPSLPGARESIGERLVGGPEGLRKRLQRMGPIWITAGQFLALRPDLLPRAYCDELMLLLDHVPPFPWEQAERIIREDLGGDLREVFSVVNRRPLAAGSLAQAHSALLLDGTEVVVKLRRPGVEERVERDLSRVRLLARALEASGVSLLVSAEDVAREITQWMLQELDFDQELWNTERLYDLTAGSPFERVPEPFAELCGPRMLTAERLRGVRFTDLLRAVQSEDDLETNRIERLGIDRSELAETLLSAVLRQIFTYQFFHADVHPGNLLALPDGRIGFIDFGLCDELDAKVRERQLNYLAAAYSGDVDLMFDALAEILIPTEQSDMSAFRRDFAAETRRWMSEVASAGPRNSTSESVYADEYESPISRWMVGTLRTARRHGFELPARVLAMYRTLLTAETVATQLNRDSDLRAVGRDFFARLRLREQMRALEPENLQPVAASALAVLRDSPRQAHRVLTDLSEGRLLLAVDVSESPRTRRDQRTRTRLVASSIGAVAFAVLLNVKDLPEIAGASLAWAVGAVFVALCLVALAQWRRLR